MSRWVVEAEGLSFAYRKGSAPVLQIPELKIARGQKVFIHGPSGSGKTTLLSLLSGVLLPQAGQLKVLGQNWADLSTAARDRFRGEHLGYIFQIFNLIPYLNVQENVLLPCKLHPARRARIKGSLEDKARELMQHLGLEDFIQQKVTELSVGQQQRVAAARALLGAPQLLIADEPTSALDSDHREMFLKLLFKECEALGTTLLFVSHDHSLKTLFNVNISLRELNKVSA